MKPHMCSCGWRIFCMSPVTVKCSQCGATVTCTDVPGLGDRVAAVISKFYKPKKKCGGCLKRQQNLNELGKKLTRKK